MKYRIIIFILLLSCFCLSGFTQSKLRFVDPVKLGNSVNTDAEESMPVLSPDGKTLYFTRTFYIGNTGGKLAGQDIWMSSGNGKDQWGTAQNKLGKLNNENNNAVVGISADGSVLYLMNVYSSGKKMKHGISASIHNTSETPAEIKIPALQVKGNNYGFYMHPSGTILLISAELEDSKGQEDLYVSFMDKSNNWSVPLNLGSVINTSSFEMSPFLDDDGKTLYFSTSGRGGYGNADIFVSERKGDSWTDWTPPRNMGKKINSRGFDAYFIKQGNSVFFASNKAGELSDIYFTRIVSEEELQAMLPKPQSVLFVLNTYIISGEAKEVLEEVAKVLKENEELKVSIFGHTCQLGNEAGNIKLSELRAQSVSDFLQIYGIGAERITVSGKGDELAKKQSGDEQTQNKYRKAEIIFGYME